MRKNRANYKIKLSTLHKLVALADAPLVRVDRRRAAASKQAKKMCAEHVRKRKRRSVELCKANGRKRVWQLRRCVLLGWQMMVARMAPGEWYEIGEIYVLMLEYAQKSVRAWIKQKGVDGGLVERTLNVDRKARSDAGTGGVWMGVHYFYRLTDLGIKKRAEWRALISGG